MGKIRKEVKTEMVGLEAVHSLVNRAQTPENEVNLWVDVHFAAVTHMPKVKLVRLKAEIAKRAEKLGTTQNVAVQDQWTHKTLKPTHRAVR